MADEKPEAGKAALIEKPKRVRKKPRLKMLEPRLKELPPRLGTPPRKKPKWD